MDTLDFGNIKVIGDILLEKGICPTPDPKPEKKPKPRDRAIIKNRPKKKTHNKTDQADYRKNYYLKNRETILKKAKEKYRTDENFASAQKQRQKEYNKKNKDHISEYNKYYYDKHRRQLMQYFKDYYHDKKNNSQLCELALSDESTYNDHLDIQLRDFLSSG